MKKIFKLMVLIMFVTILFGCTGATETLKDGSDVSLNNRCFPTSGSLKYSETMASYGSNVDYYYYDEENQTYTTNDETCWDGYDFETNMGYGTDPHDKPSDMEVDILNSDGTSSGTVDSDSIKVSNVSFAIVNTIQPSLNTSFDIDLNYSGLNEGQKYIYRVYSNKADNSITIKDIRDGMGDKIYIVASVLSNPSDPTSYYVKIPIYTELNFNGTKYSAIINDGDLGTIFASEEPSYIGESFTMTGDATLPAGKTVDLVLNGNTIDFGEFTFTINGELIISDNKTTGDIKNVQIVNNGEIILGPIKTSGDFYKGEASSDINKKVYGIDSSYTANVTSSQLTTNDFTYDQATSTITIKKEYLNTLDVGEYYFDFTVTGQFGSIEYKIPVVVVNKQTTPSNDEYDDYYDTSYSIVNTCVR